MARDFIQNHRGTKSTIPSLGQGEIGITTDTDELFAGGGNGNFSVSRREVDTENVTGVDNEEKVVNAKSAGETRNQPIVIPKEFGSVDYDSFESDADIEDRRLGLGRLLPNINNRQINFGGFLHDALTKVVVTGDSLSFNRYSYDTNSYDKATQYPYGLKSWSYLMRDAMIQNLPGWCYANDLLAGSDSTATLSEFESTYDQFKLPLDGKVMRFEFANIGDIAEVYLPNPLSATQGRGSGIFNQWLYFMTNLDFGTYDVRMYRVDNGAQVGGTFSFTNEGNGDFQDLAMKSAQIANLVGARLYRMEIEATAVGVSGAVLEIVGTALTDFEWYNTGDAGETSEWLKNNVSTLVNQYDPDLTVITIGANDSWNNVTEEECYQNVKSAIESIKANTDSEIILVSGTPQDPNNANGSVDAVTQSYSRMLRKVASEFNCGYLDIHNVMNVLNSSDWRFDWVHYNRYGNQIVFESFMQRFFPTLDIRGVNQYNHRNQNDASGVYRRPNREILKEMCVPSTLFDIANTTGNVSTRADYDNAFIWNGRGARVLKTANITFVTNSAGKLVIRIKQPFKIGYYNPKFELYPINYRFSNDHYMFKPSDISLADDYIEYIVLKQVAGVFQSISSLAEMGDTSIQVDMKF